MDYDEDYGDDPTDDLPAVSELGLLLLERHRKHPDDDAYILIDGFTITQTDEAYKILGEHGLVDYTEQLVDVAGERRFTFMLSRNGL